MLEKRILITALLNLMFLGSTAQHIAKRASPDRKLIYEADFKREVDTSEWMVEMEPLPDSKVYSKNGKLTIDSKGGVTVWLNKRLQGNILIEYKRRVVVDGNGNDRLSDLNQFWMATDPRDLNLFTRQGTFGEYDSLQLYYVGMGGNSNSTTRFRKYDGQGNKTLIQEYKDADHLLRPGKTYHISIAVQGSSITFLIDDVPYFTYDDPVPLREGYFGFRTVHSRQEIEDFRIYEFK